MAVYNQLLTAIAFSSAISIVTTHLAISFTKSQFSFDSDGLNGGCLANTGEDIFIFGGWDNNGIRNKIIRWNLSSFTSSTPFKHIGSTPANMGCYGQHTAYSYTTQLIYIIGAGRAGSNSGAYWTYDPSASLSLVTDSRKLPSTPTGQYPENSCTSVIENSQRNILITTGG
eukprot:106687_1